MQTKASINNATIHLQRKLLRPPEYFKSEINFSKATLN